MNIFSNIGITELIIILLLALVVVGPERLPEMGRKLGKTLRDLRQMYDNLTSDLGPELMSIQQTTQELRESVDSVTSIPKDMVQTVVQAADLDDTIDELKGVADSVSDMGKTLSSAGKVIQDPVGAAVSTARDALVPSEPAEEDPPSPEAEQGPALHPEPDVTAGAGLAPTDDAASDDLSHAQTAVPFTTDEPQSADDSATKTAETFESAADTAPNTGENKSSAGDTQAATDE